MPQNQSSNSCSDLQVMSRVRSPSSLSSLYSRGERHGLQLGVGVALEDVCRLPLHHLNSRHRQK